MPSQEGMKVSGGDIGLQSAGMAEGGLWGIVIHNAAMEDLCYSGVHCRSELRDRGVSRCSEQVRRSGLVGEPILYFFRCGSQTV